jgi:hypothetical protein
VRTTDKPTQIGEDHAEMRIFPNAESYPVLRLRVCGLAYKEGDEPEPPAPAPGSDAGSGDDCPPPAAIPGTHRSSRRAECSDRAQQNRAAGRRSRSAHVLNQPVETQPAENGAA